MGTRLAAMALGLMACRSVPKGPLPAGRPAELVSQGCNLHGSLALSATTFALGTPVTATFRLTSDCEKNLPLLAAGDRESKYGRSEGYSVSAVTADGNGASSLLGGETFGGGMGHVEFDREHPLEAKLRLQDYLEFQDPGRYEVRVVTHKIIGADSLTISVSAFVDVSK